MTKEKTYSAGLVSHCFWFLEFKKLVILKKEGLSYDEIREKCLKENLIGASKEQRAKQITGYLMTRLKTMNDKLIDIFVDSDLTTQKMINLITILRNDKLFFDFMYEEYRDKVILGAKNISTDDVQVFFSKKETECEKISSWSKKTRTNLASTYLNFLRDTGLITMVNKSDEINPCIINKSLENYLRENNEIAILKALKGEI